MANPLLGTFRGAQTLRQLDKASADLEAFLRPYAVADVAMVVYEPGRDDTLPPGLTSTVDATSTDYAYTATNAGPVWRATTGATANAYAQLKCDSVGLNASKNPGMEVIFSTNVATGGVEFGLSDPLVDDTLPALGTFSPPVVSNGATDCGFFWYQSASTQGLVADGTGVAADKSNLLSTYPMPTGLTNFNKIMIQVMPGGVYCVINDIAQLAMRVSTGPAANVLMRPHCLIGTFGAADYTLDIKYLRVWQDR
jgi:hypothetical protein